MSVVFEEDFGSKTKNFVLKEFDKKLSLSGGKMTGDLNMGNHNIVHASNYVPSSDWHTTNKKYVENWSLANAAACIYTLQMDDKGMFNASDDINFIIYSGSNKKVGEFSNLSRKEDLEIYSERFK